MGIGHNILTLRTKKSLSRAQLAEILDVSEAQIGFYENGKNQPGKDKLAKLAKVFNLSVADLYQDNLVEKLTQVRETGQSVPGQDKIPFWDTIAVGGNVILADQSPVDQPNDMIYPGTFLSRATGALRVYGHSMFPKYPAGCIIAYRDADKEVIIWGEDYVIELQDRRIIKRLEKSDLMETVKAVSYNKSVEYVYAPIDIPVRNWLRDCPGERQDSSGRFGMHD